MPPKDDVVSFSPVLTDGGVRKPQWSLTYSVGGSRSIAPAGGGKRSTLEQKASNDRRFRQANFSKHGSLGGHEADEFLNAVLDEGGFVCDTAF